MNQPSLNFDTPIRREQVDVCERKHGGAATSIAANKRVNKEADNQKVLKIIREKGVSWSKQIANEMGKPLNCISGRITFLKANGYIVPVEGVTEEGCQVYRCK